MNFAVAVRNVNVDRLAREGSDWANLRFVTPYDIAAQMGAPFLVEGGIDPSEEGLGPALVMRLLLESGLTADVFGNFLEVIEHVDRAVELEVDALER